MSGCPSTLDAFPRSRSCECVGKKTRGEERHNEEQMCFISNFYCLNLGNEGKERDRNQQLVHSPGLVV